MDYEEAIVIVFYHTQLFFHVDMLYHVIFSAVPLKKNRRWIKKNEDRAEESWRE